MKMLLGGEPYEILSDPFFCETMQLYLNQAIAG